MNGLKNNQPKGSDVLITIIIIFAIALFVVYVVSLGVGGAA